MDLVIPGPLAPDAPLKAQICPEMPGHPAADVLVAVNRGSEVPRHLAHDSTSCSIHGALRP